MLFRSTINTAHKHKIMSLNMAPLSVSAPVHKGQETAQIHRLSVDILFIIFSLLRDLEPVVAAENTIHSDEKVWQWYTVTHVCRYWRAAAISTPFLWSRLNFFQDPRKTESFLERSKNADLTIIATSDHLDDALSPAMQDCYVKILQCMHRIRSMHITFEAAMLWKEKHGSPAPRLRELAVSGGPFEQVGLTIDHSESAPLLESLDLSTFSTPNIISFSRHLKILSLKTIKDVPKLALLSALASCQELTRLSLDFLSWADPTDMPLASTTAPTIFLPNLAFVFVGCSEPYMRGLEQVLEHIHFPNSTEWSIYSIAGDIGSLFEKRFYAGFTRKILQCQALEIIVSPRSFSLSSWNSMPDPRSVSAPSAKILVGWLTLDSVDSIFTRIGASVAGCRWREAKVVKLQEVHFDEHVIGRECWEAVLRALPSTETLHMTTNPDTMGNLVTGLRVLTHQQVEEDSDKDCVCPRLRHLSTVIHSGSRDVISCLKEGLQNRRRLGLEIKEISITCKSISKANRGELKVLSDLVETMNVYR